MGNLLKDELCRKKSNYRTVSWWLLLVFQNFWMIEGTTWNERKTFRDQSVRMSKTCFRPHASDFILPQWVHWRISRNHQHVWNSKLQRIQSNFLHNYHFSFSLWSNVWRCCSWKSFTFHWIVFNSVRKMEVT